MLAAFLLTLRETLEAVLIVGIVLSTLRTTQRSQLDRFVWLGTAMGVILSAVITLLLNRTGAVLEGTAEQIFEGLTMLLAASVLTWMIFWMQKQSRPFHQGLKDDVLEAGRIGRGFPLFSLAFLAVFREGLELSLFLTAASFSSEWPTIMTGASIGIVLAIGLGWALSTGLMRLDLKRFFLITSILLILVAGGLVAHGVHELNEPGWIPAIVEHVWDLNPWFNETSTMGQIMTALFGYNGDPSLSEVLATFTYYGMLILTLFHQGWQFRIKNQV